MAFLNMMVSFQAAYVKTAQGGTLPVKHSEGKNPYTSPAMRAALDLYSLHRGEDTQESGALRSSAEAALPLELKLMIIRNRIKNN